MADSHELQWMKIEAENCDLSENKDDIYDRRAQSCTRLLNKLK